MADLPGRPRSGKLMDVAVGSDHPVSGPGGQTLVGRIMASGPAVVIMAAVPVPLWLVRRALTHDNSRENAKDSWNRLRNAGETARYAEVRAVTERYAADGFVLDIGCSQGILQEGLRYRRYLGVDSFASAIEKATDKCDDRTAFVCADGSSYQPDRSPDAVVLNEVLYYLPDPVAAAEHYADLLSPDGALIVSIYARSWASQRLLGRLARRLRLVHDSEASSGHLAWSVTAYRPR